MPLEISSTVTEYRFGDTEAPAIELSATDNDGDVNWSTDSGFLDTPVGLSSILSPLNRTQVVTVTATDDSDTVTLTIQVWATLPVQPKWTIEVDIAPPLVRWPMAYEKREMQEYWDLLSFFRFHGKAVLEISEAEDGSVKVRVLQGIPFYVADIASGLLAKVYFDSNFRASADGYIYAYSFQLVGFEFEIPETVLVGPFYGLSEYGG